MEAADAALLDAVERDVLAPDVVALVAVQEATAALCQEPTDDPSRANERRAALHEADAQLGRLTEAVKLGGPLPSLVAEIKATEERRATLHRSLMLCCAYGSWGGGLLAGVRVGEVTSR